VYYGKAGQRGHGIGSVLGSLGRIALPFLKGIGSYLGRRALSTGVDIGTDLLSGKSFKQSAKTRLSEGARGIVGDVVNKLQSGSGRKRKRQTKKECKKGKRRKTVKTCLD